MRTVLGMIALAIASPVAAQEAQPVPAYTNAEACLRQRAAEAVQAGRGAADAAEFLLLYVCAGPVDAATAYKRNTEALNAFRLAMHQMNSMGAFAAEDESANEDSAEPGQDSVSPPPNPFLSMDGVSVDQVTGQFVTNSESGPMAAMVAAQAQTQSQGQVLSIPAFLRTLAGQVVIASPR